MALEFFEVLDLGFKNLMFKDSIIKMRKSCNLCYFFENSYK